MNHQHTIEQLRGLRLTGMAEAFAQQLSDVVFGELSFEQRLQMLVDAENTQRSTQRYQRILKNAKLKVVAAPEDIDYRAERGLDKSVMADLMSCAWIGRHRNLLITGATGTGKTWLACALGVQAARQGITVAYRRTARLLEEMAIGQRTPNTTRTKPSWCRRTAPAAPPGMFTMQPTDCARLAS